MKICPALTQQFRDRSPVLDFQMIPFSDQHQTQIIHYRVEFHWVFIFDIFKGDVCKLRVT
jgi:hypothetical protein